MVETLTSSQSLFQQINQIGFWYALLLGFVVGSFLNVVIYRLPRVLFSDVESDDKEVAQPQTFFGNLKCLVHPGSTTPCCQHAIVWSDNIPLFSWLRLKGKCRHCQATISPRYFLVELLTGLCFALIFLQLGMSWATPLYCFFIAILIALFFIDLETYYLPDYLTFLAITLGLAGSVLGITSVQPQAAVVGACGGYLLPWTVNYLYRLVRKRDGFGGGDFKLLAVFGAWLGFSAILPILAIASFLALSVFSLVTLFQKEKWNMERMLPFGPFLILAGTYILIFGAPSWLFQEMTLITH